MTRSVRWWKAHVVGGVAVEEVTRNARAVAWHPHLHLISDADVAQAAVLQGKRTALWAAVTRDSFILDLRPFRGATVAHDLRELPMLGAGMIKGRGLPPSLAKWTWVSLTSCTRDSLLDRA
jgi:hypothetical protein